MDLQSRALLCSVNTSTTATIARPPFSTPLIASRPLRRAISALIAVALALGIARTAQAQRPIGVDVSDYQGSGINWTTVKNSGVSFAWTKATEGASGQYVSQASFTVNEANAKAVGVYIGAYHFAHPERNAPSTEVSYFWSVAGSYIKADGLTFMPMLDMEVFSGVTGAASYADWVNDWCTDAVQDAANGGVRIKPFIYVSACNAGNFDSTVSQWFSDIADYNSESAQTGTPWSTCTADDVWGGWNIWQYTDAAIEGDGDVFNGTLATMTNSCLATASTNSTIYYWDPQGTTGANPYTGSMTGTWENNDWSYGFTGLASPVAWAEGKAVTFGVNTGSGTPAFTVTMNSDHVVAGFFDGALSPKSCDVTITGSGVINLASGPQALDSAISSDGATGFLRINVPIAGEGQLFPEGKGQSFLNSSNSYSGGTQLGYHDSNGSNPFSGIVNFNNGSAFGTGTITLTTYGNGGALVLTGTAAVTVSNAISVASATSNNIVGNPAGLTFSGNWGTGANLLTLGTGNTAGNQVIISGVVSGTAGLTVTNLGTLVLSGVNTYSGTTTIKSPAVLTIGGAGQLGSGSYAGSIVNGGTFNYSSTAAQTVSGVISGAGALKQNGAGKLTLTAANTYTGNTTVSAGTLALGAGGSIGASAVTVSSSGTLANVTTTTRTIGGTTTFGAGGLASFTATGGSSTVIGKISVTGNLALSGYGATINVSGSSLAAGTYRLMDCTGTLSGSASSIPTISGTPLAAGLTASVSTTAGAAGHVDLVVAKSTPSFSNLTASPSVTYGSTGIILGGRIAASGPVYPPSGEVIAVTINGNAQTTNLSDSTGDFSINYSLSGLPANIAPYTITYSYAGDADFNSASNASTALTLNPLPVALTGTRPYDGTTTAASGILSVTNALGGDVVTVASGSGTLASPNVGLEAISSFGTLALGGAASGNYTLAGAAGSVAITTPPFSITNAGLDITGTNFIITWQSAPGATYHVVGGTNVSAPLNTWPTVAGPIVATDTNTSVTNPISSSMSVFDVISP